MVAAQHFVAQHAVLRLAALQQVAVGQVAAAVVDLSLDDETLADRVFIVQVLADADHRQRDLVAQHHRLRLHVAAKQPRMRAAGPDHLDVGEADAARVVAHQQLVRSVGRHRHADRPTVQSQVLKTLAIQRPQPIRIRQRCGRLAILSQFVTLHPVILHSPFEPPHAQTSEVAGSVG